MLRFSGRQLTAAYVALAVTLQLMVRGFRSIVHNFVLSRPRTFTCRILFSRILCFVALPLLIRTLDRRSPHGAFVGGRRSPFLLQRLLGYKKG